MIWPLLVGAGFGAGVWLVVRGVRPPRPSLAEALAEIGRIEPPAGSARAAAPGRRLGAVAIAIGDVLRRRGATEALVRERVRRDLAVVGRDVDDHVVARAAVGLVVFFGIAAGGALLWVAGGPAPAVPLGLALLLGLAASFVPDLAVHAAAERRRAEVRHAVTALVQGTRLAGAAGFGVDEALQRAAATWDNWVFLEIRRALDSAALHGETPWEGLSRLGREMGTIELRELAEVFGLARDQGARVRATLDARAATLQSQRLAEREAAGHRANIQMVFAIGLIVYAFMALLIYPFVGNVLANAP